MYYSRITKADMRNGEGLRVVLWLNGCQHGCIGCNNQLSWKANSGLFFDQAAKEELMKELEQDWCSGLTLSGGDPLFQENRAEVLNLVEELKKRFPLKTIWCYTGYTWEELLDQKETDTNLDLLLQNIDVLLDGKFLLPFVNKNLQYVGSENQRILDVQKSNQLKKPVLYLDNSRYFESRRQ